MEEKLRTEILHQLRKVDDQNAPHLFNLIQTEAGYREVENRIIYMVAREHITPSACIPHIENELQ